MSGSEETSAEEEEEEAGAELVGTVLADRYRVLEKIGGGGMGYVYHATHMTLHRSVAVKVLHPELCRDESLVQRFLQEARAASKIGHGSIVDILDFGRTDDRSVFYVMEYLEGEDLSATLAREGRIPWRRARSMALQIAHGLAACHAAGVIHRDLKPANCFLTREDDKEIITLLDFGVAKITDTSRNEPPLVTRGGMVFGTPGYMAPEQASGLPADPRTDVYATAACVYEFLTGSAPFVGNNFMQVVSRVLTQPLLAPSVRAPDNVPPAVEKILLQALARDPNDRPPNMMAFAEAIEALHPDLEPQIPTAAPNKAVDDHKTLRVRAGETGESPTEEAGPNPAPNPMLRQTLVAPWRASRPAKNPLRITQVAPLQPASPSTLGPPPDTGTAPNLRQTQLAPLGPASRGAANLRRTQVAPAGKLSFPVAAAVSPSASPPADIQAPERSKTWLWVGVIGVIAIVGVVGGVVAGGSSARRDAPATAPAEGSAPPASTTPPVVVSPAVVAPPPVAAPPPSGDPLPKALTGPQISAGFKGARAAVASQCGKHPGTQVKVQATVSGAGAVVSAEPSAGQDSGLARCVAKAVAESARFAATSKKIDTFQWTYRL